jgi:hypothetical protein
LGSEPIQPMWQPPQQQPQPQPSQQQPPWRPPASPTVPGTPAAQTPQQAAPLFQPPSTSEDEPAAEEEERPALPRRVRQASLAPQLRDEQLTDPGVAEENDERSPDELRTMLSSIQKGWLRGRSAAEQIDEDQQEDQ